MPDKPANHRVVSAGAVIYRWTTEGPRLLLVQSFKSAPSWGFPKGHVEPGEEVLEAAYREVMEESGVKIHQIIKPLPACKTKNKIVKLFLANTFHQGEPCPQDPDGEIAAAGWFTSEDCEGLIHRYQRKALKAAMEYLDSSMAYNPLAVDEDICTPIRRSAHPAPSEHERMDDIAYFRKNPYSVLGVEDPDK